MKASSIVQYGCHSLNELPPPLGWSVVAESPVAYGFNHRPGAREYVDMKQVEIQARLTKHQLESRSQDIESGRIAGEETARRQKNYRQPKDLRHG